MRRRMVKIDCTRPHSRRSTAARTYSPISQGGAISTPFSRTIPAEVDVKRKTARDVSEALEPANALKRSFQPSPLALRRIYSADQSFCHLVALLLLTLTHYLMPVWLLYVTVLLGIESVLLSSLFPVYRPTLNDSSDLGVCVLPIINKLRKNYVFFCCRCS